MFDSTERETDIAAADPVVRMRAALTEVGDEEREEWTSDAMSDRLVELIELRERLDAELVRMTAGWHRKRGWEADGALSPVPWLTHRAPITAPAARRLVHAARLTDSSDRLATALAEGDTTTPHVEALARVLSPARRPLLADHEEVLTKQAERLSIEDFTILVRRWAALADDQLAPDTHDDHQPTNELHVSVTMDGWVDGTFRLDPVTGTQLLDTLDHLAPPDPADAPDGVRSLTHRRGDALADLASWYHRGGVPGGNPPNVSVVVDVATLNGVPVDLARARRDLDGVGPITQATLDRIGCGATLSRVVMAGTSVILDMGRKSRLATSAQARAIRIRDGGCVFPSCDRPAPWCDIHHTTPWTKGGKTNVADMVCLCTRHHTLVHNSKWTIVTNPDGTYTARHPTRAP